jgi:pyruvate kinase
MHVARLNFSHSGTDYSYPEKLIGLIREARGKHQNLLDGAVDRNMPKNLRAVLVDTKGPEIRTQQLQGDASVAHIATGAIVEVTTEPVWKDEAPPTPEGPHRLQVDYAKIAKSVTVGSQILLDDGLIALDVTDIKGGVIYTVAVNGGPIKKNKGVNLPGTKIDLPALTEKDKSDLKWSCKIRADFVAASFIRTAANVRSVIAFLDRCVAELEQSEPGSKYMRPLVISKIEVSDKI